MSDNPSTNPGHDVTLDDFRLCEVPGCIWHVLQPARRCSEHGGPKGPEVPGAPAGGRNSANTRILAEICASAGTETRHIETADEIQDAWLERGRSVGVTSGTSIPDNVIDEVMLRLKECKRGPNRR